ncbi:CU044_5270 family protein [Nonomuraea sp. NPDC050556]|uniref:CU044_5270 family protein n=1 Tax=Nonomuraea sp. NPDC050556 TaxID=3364369 RepID=UPI0037B85725
MDDEIRMFAEGRPSAPPYREEARQEARRRLVRETQGRGGFRLPRFTLQVAGAFALTVVLVGGVSVALTSGSGSQGSVGSASVSVEPQLTFPELTPRPDQYLLVESETMFTSEGDGRYLYRTYRKFYRPVDGNRQGLLWIEGRSPKEWPGNPLPESAKDWQGGSWMEIDGHCPGTSDAFRNDYAYLSTLPTDAEEMKKRLYKPAPEGKDISPDQEAFTAFGDMVRETYLPLAQRKALVEAVKTIPGVEVAEGVEDSAGRKGMALGRVSETGQLAQWIFDPETYTFLGERGTVVDAAKAQAPVGSVMALTAQLKVTVVDALPEVEDADKDGSCEMATQQPTNAPTPMPTGPSPSDSAAPTDSVAPTPTPTGSAPPSDEFTVSSTLRPEATITKTVTPTPTG